MTLIWKAWPQWLTGAVVAAYRDGRTPAEIGATISRSEAVIRAKLVREGVYVSAAIKRKAYVAEQAEGF